MREENQTEENQTDDQQTSESQQKDNTTDGSSEMITSRTITTAMPVIRITIPNRNIVGTTIPEKVEETLIHRKMEKIPINRTIAEPRIIAVIPERVEIPVVETYNKHI